MKVTWGSHSIPTRRTRDTFCARPSFPSSLFLGMEVICLGCGDAFTDSRMYATHKARYCVPKADLGKAVSKRKAKAEAEREVARTRKRVRREEEENARMEEVISTGV